MASLEGKTVLLTGAATGIGRAIAIGCAEAGARLVIGDVADGAMAEVVAEVERMGGAIRARHCDVRSQPDIDQLVALARDSFSVPDIVFANAGIEGRVDMPWGYQEDEVSGLMDINFTGIWRTLKATIPLMVARGSGSFVATSSVAGLVGAEGMPIYVASKHAVNGLMRATAIAVAAQNVRVNSICPGMIKTPLLDRLLGEHPDLGDILMAKKPMKRLGEVDEVARAAIWLASDEASFVTGHTLVIDGGFTAQ